MSASLLLDLKIVRRTHQLAQLLLASFILFRIILQTFDRLSLLVKRNKYAGKKKKINWRIPQVHLGFLRFPGIMASERNQVI